jgi:peptidyl-prolyl cis-trans isomerase SurA
MVPGRPSPSGRRGGTSGMYAQIPSGGVDPAAPIGQTIPNATKRPRTRRDMTFQIGPRALIVAAILALSGPFLMMGSAARAQEEMRAAALVNDQAISIFELAQRTRLAILAAGIKPTPEIQKRLARQVLRSLIDERLELQEATRNNINVTQNDINEAVSRVAKQNNMSREEFMKVVAQSGVAPSILEEQFRARIAWASLLQAKIYRQVEISDEEIDEAIARIEANVGKPEYQVSEIFLDVATPEQEDEVRATGERMVQQVAQGASFSALARQFSQSATAAVGGDLGWIQQGQLAPELDAVLPTMKVGEVVGPVRTFGGFHIIALRDKRLVTLSGQGSDRLSLKQIFLSLPRNPTQDQIDGVEAKIKAIEQEVKSCDDMEQAGKAHGDAGSGDLGEVTVDDLPKPIAAAVEGLDVGELSTPVRIGAGVTILMVCERSKASAGADREAIKNKLFQEEVSMRARRYIRDLRRTAFVDIRL